MSNKELIKDLYVIRQRTNLRYALFKQKRQASKFEIVRRENDNSILEFNTSEEALRYCRAKFKLTPQLM